jgi:hypothetical protein
MCWIGLARKVSESDRAVLLEEDVRWERGYHTWCEPCLLGLAMEAKIPEARAVRTACGGIVESAPEAAAPRSPLPASESHKDFAVLPCRDNIPTRFLPHRSTISDESPIDWTTVGASRPVPATAVVGWTGCRP